MKKNCIIKIITIIIILFSINYIPTISSATIIDDTFADAKDFISTNTEQSIKDDVNGATIVSLSKQIYNLLLTVGIIVAVVIIFVLGIQFMTGSVEQKVKVKEMLMPFIVGCIVVFGSLGIWRLVITITSSVL